MSNQHMEELNDQQIVRREKMVALAEQGIDPFGKRFERTATSGQLKEKYADKTKEELHEINETATIAGRLMTKRGKGKVGFAHIQDRDGQIQIYVRKDAVGEENYDIFKKADLGDFLGVEGEVMRTDMGELSIKATHITHLSKALRPLPEKFHGLSDVETIYRKRYLDLISNRESFDRFVTRSKIISEIRRYLDAQGFLEVETPVLHNEAGGAAAKPFITHHNAQNIDMVLRIATELHLKRLIVGGMERVYEIGRIFRNEGMDRTHNPEFTCMEIYVAYKDYNWMMKFTENMIEKICLDVNGTTEVQVPINYQGTEIKINEPFKRIHMVDAIKEITGVDFWQDMTLDEAKAIAAEKNVPVENIITPPMYIGVPALQAISYCMNDESLRNMYAELLAHAMNSDTVDNVHPTYVEIIKQMSPYDALIFQNLVKELVKPCISLRYEKMDASGYPIIDCFAFADVDSFPIIPTQISLENLERLRLIEINKNFHYSNENKYRELRQSTGLNKMLEEYVIDNENNLPSNEYKIVASEFAIMVRGFGQFFARACLGTDFSDIS